jgi:hypothetical protein
LRIIAARWQAAGRGFGRKEAGCGDGIAGWNNFQCSGNRIESLPVELSGKSVHSASSGGSRAGQPLREGIMLAWSRLSKNQRACGAFLFVVFLFGSPFLVTSVASISSRAQIGGALLCSIGLILNPLSFTPHTRAATNPDPTPIVCRGFFLVGAILFFTGVIVTPFFL